MGDRGDKKNGEGLWGDEREAMGVKGEEREDVGYERGGSRGHGRKEAKGHR